MSEALPGMPEAPPPIPTKDAAAVILYRRVEGGVEIFWLKRELKLRYAGGFYAFPGGKVDKTDAAVPVDGAIGKDAALLVAAARELFEETGVLVAHGADRLSQPTLVALRKELLEDAARFGGMLVDHGLSLRARDFTPAGRWVTPKFMPIGRFDARFYLVEVPAQQRAEVWPGELAEGSWVRPADALKRWELGTALLHPPNFHAVASMAKFKDHESARVALSTPLHCPEFIAERLEFQRGVHLWPLRTPTLLPATHTNAWVLGTRELVVVDPGAPDHAETDQLIRFLEELKDEGHRLKAIVLTHQHGDHIGGVPRMMEKLNVPVWAHALTKEQVPFPVTRTLADGDVIELDGPLKMHWRVVHTPGHARGHLCLIDEVSRAAVVGDMVAGIGTIVIDPPEGDMAEYVAQLLRLKALGVGTLNPAHGPVMPEGPQKLDEYVAHRKWREEKVLAALTAAPDSLEALVPRAYDDVQALVWPIAERSTLAILLKLEREGRARRSGEAWQRA